MVEGREKILGELFSRYKLLFVVITQNCNMSSHVADVVLSARDVMMMMAVVLVLGDGFVLQVSM